MKRVPKTQDESHTMHLKTDKINRMEYLLLIFFVLLILSNASAQDFPNPPRPWQEAYNISLKNIEFSHPMTAVNKKEQAEILRCIKNKIEPQYSAYLKLLVEADASLTFVPNPPASMNIMGGYEKNSNLSEMRTILWGSSYAAYSSALAYCYSGEKKYADKATEILMSWTDQATVFTGADRGLQLGSYFNGMLYAADLLHNYDGWIKTDRQKFESWWQKNCLEDGDVLGVMRRKDNNWKDAAILGTITAAVVFEDTLLLKEALIQQTSYFYKRTDKNVRNPGEAWKFSKDEKGKYLLREVVRNNGRSGLTYTAYALTTMVQHFEIASYFGFDFWHRKTPGGAFIKGIIQQYYKWDILNEEFPWHNSPKKTTVRQNLYELANKHFDMGDEFRKWLKENRPVEGRQGDAFSTLNKGNLFLQNSSDMDTYKGCLNLKGEATGFFHIEKFDGRFLLVTPEGYGFYPLGINHIGTNRQHANIPEFSSEKLASEKILLRNKIFNPAFSNPYYPVAH